MTLPWLPIIAALVVTNVALVVWMHWRQWRQELALRSMVDATLEAGIRGQLDELRRFERMLLDQSLGLAREHREELASAVDRLAAGLNHQMGTIASVQNAQIDGFAAQLAKLTEVNELRLASLRESLAADARAARDESSAGLTALSQSLQSAVGELSARNESRLLEVRETLQSRMGELLRDNASRLEEMRRTVDEKLHATLEQRLGESFRIVSERLEQVHRGLGEMQALASDVGDLKRVLTNVKSRGTWGEVQLGALLEQMLVPDQYGVNVEVVPGSNERVEFAIRLPGRSDEHPVWLPVDAKFPREDYERLAVALERADVPGADAAGRQLEVRLREEARKIRSKYVLPPSTTDFALLFLPTEGLYAEVVRRPGLMDALQREHRVVVAGPTTLAAILSSLQMGFRTLAVEQRSSEVWQLLGAVKAEFGKFGDMLARTRRQLESAANSISEAEGKTRTIERRLRKVEILPGAPPVPPLFPGDDESPG